MAFASNTEHFSPKKIPNTLDPCVASCPTASYDTICSPDIRIPSCSYAQPVLLNNYPPFKQLTPKLSSIESILNYQLHQLVQQKLVYRVRKGNNHDTLSFHRRTLMEEMKQFLHPCDESFQDFSYRDKLITLLASSSKTPVIDIPIDILEWHKLLNQWIRNHVLEDIIFNREIYAILAVDGFYGFKPKELKHYLSRILLPLRYEFQLHTQAVRSMYRWIAKNPLVASLPGTNSACLIFLALLEFYTEQLVKLLFDDQMRFQVQQAKSRAEGFLHKHSDYYRDIKNVDEALVISLSQVYSKEFTDPEKCKNIAEEMFKLLK